MATLNRSGIDQLLKNKVYRRAKGRIFQGDARAFQQYILIGVWKSPTIGGTVLIDGTKVIGPQERTGGGLHYIIPFFIQSQVGFDERAFLHPQYLADALDVRCLEPGGILLAAVGAGQAISVLEGLIVKILQFRQYLFLIRPLQKTTIVLRVIR